MQSAIDRWGGQNRNSGAAPASEACLSLGWELKGHLVFLMPRFPEACPKSITS